VAFVEITIVPVHASLLQRASSLFSDDATQKRMGRYDSSSLVVVGIDFLSNIQESCIKPKQWFSLAMKM
jgi:hypothetical protein